MLKCFLCTCRSLVETEDGALKSTAHESFSCRRVMQESDLQWNSALFPQIQSLNPLVCGPVPHMDAPSIMTYKQIWSSLPVGRNDSWSSSWLCTYQLWHLQGWSRVPVLWALPTRYWSWRCDEAGTRSHNRTELLHLAAPSCQWLRKSHHPTTQIHLEMNRNKSKCKCVLKRQKGEHSILPLPLPRGSPMALIMIWPLPKQWEVWGLARPHFQNRSMGSTIWRRREIERIHGLGKNKTFLQSTVMY